MAKATVQPADMRCNKCGASKFIVGKRYISGNSASYVIRCACCLDGNGSAHMIKNVNEAYYNALVNLGRIYTAPVVGSVAPVGGTPTPDTAPAASLFGNMPSRPTTAKPLGTVDSPMSTMGTSALPPAFQQTAEPDFPFDTLTGQAAPPLQPEPPYDVIPGEPVPEYHASQRNPGVAPTPISMVSQAGMGTPTLVQQSPVHNSIAPPPFSTNSAVPNIVSTPKPNNCPLCHGHKPIKVPHSDYAMRLEGSKVEYYEEVTGQILFQQAIMYCPMCGGKL